MRKQKFKFAAGICTTSILCLAMLLIILIQNPFSNAPEASDSAGNSIPSETSSDDDSSSDLIESADDTDETTETTETTETENTTETEETPEEPSDISYLEQCELDYVAPPVKRNREQALERIREMSLHFPILHLVYENANKYKSSLLMALAGNPEMADFAAGMLTREPVVTGGLRDDEQPEDYPLFLQWDIRWGYMTYGSTGSNMGSAGCGPACLSMAVFYLTGDRTCTPDVVAQYSMDNDYYVPGAGTAWSLLYDYPTTHGLTSASVSKSEAKLKKELDKGNILICSVREGNFTTGGHFILIYGYDENGFKVNDPKCVYFSRLSWPYAQIKNDFKQIWSIGKP